MSELKNLLSCWHRLEHFSPAVLPKGKSIKELHDQLPWLERALPADPKKTIEYTVYLGVFPSSVVMEFVKNFFKDPIEASDNTGGLLCCASLKLNIEGNYIKDSLGISTLPWALGQLEKKRIKENKVAEEFEANKRQFLSELEFSFPEQFDKKELLLLEDTIKEFCDWSAFPETKVFIKSEEKFIPRNRKEENTARAEILNSFYVRDLEKIISHFRESQSSKAFLSYLKGCLNLKESRTDLAKDTALLQDSLQPENYPDGCWPSKYPLSLMQQFAVNSIFHKLSGESQSGLLSVNGPPGTGKTTLLRDIIAAIVVKRAKALAEIRNPAEALKKIGKLNINDNYSPAIYSLEKRLCHGGMVIASSNNGAVENISKELPLKKEVSPFEGRVEYFREVAESCINPDNWGLISAVLGNKENRSILVNKLWFNNSKEFADLKNELKNHRPTDEDWLAAVAGFNQKLKEVEEEKKNLALYRKHCHTYEKTVQKKHKAREKYFYLHKEHEELHHQLQKQEEQLKAATDQKEKSLHELSVIQRCKPGFFTFWFNKNTRQQYNHSLQHALAGYLEIKAKYTEKVNQVNDSLEKASQIKAALKKAEGVFEKSKNKTLALEESITDAKNLLKGNYADEDFGLTWIQKSRRRPALGILRH